MDRIPNLYVLDRFDKAIGVLNPSLPNSCPFFDDVRTERIEYAYLTFEFSVPANHPQAQNLVVGNKIIYPVKNDQYNLFRIINTEDDHNDGQYIKKITCENSAVGDLLGNIILPTTLNSYTLQQALSYLLQGTNWQVGDVELSGTQNFQFDDVVTSLDALHQVMDQFGAQIEFVVQFSGLQITNRLVYARLSRGRTLNKPFVYGLNLKGAKRTEDYSQLVTALYGVGNKDSNGNLLTFDSYNPTLSYPYEKPAGAKWVGDQDALQQWSKDGNHIFGIFKDDKATNAVELFNNTLEELKKRTKPLLTYEVDVALLDDEVDLYDTIIVKDTTFQPELVLSAQIVETKTSLTDPSKNQVTLGNYQTIQLTAKDSIKEIQKRLRDTIAIANSAQTTAQEASDTATQAQTTATTAQTVANQAQSTAQQAQTTAQQASDTATNAQSVANSAQSTATAAQNTANQAQTTANNAQSVANTAQTTANNAQTVANNAQTTANQVKSTVDYWKHPADTTTIDGGKIYTGSITAYQIAAGAITADQIAAGAIDTTKISASGIQADSIKGGTLELGGVNNIKGRLEVQADDQTPIHFIDSTQASFSNCYAGYFKSPTVPFKNSDDYTIYVDPVGGSDGNDGLTTSTQLKTLQEAFNRIPDFNDGNITILIASNAGTWSESTVITLTGVHGAGTVTVDFQSRTNTLTSRIKIIQCTNMITIKNGTLKNNEVFASTLSEGCIYIQSCLRVVLDNMYFDARANSKLAYCVAVTYNSYCRINNCECYNGSSAQIVASYGSFADVRNTVGSGGTFGVLGVGGVIVGTGNAPSGSTNLQLLEGGVCNVTNPGFSFQPGTPPGAPATQTYTTTWTATRTVSWRTTYGWRSDNDYVYQGQYSSYGNHMGFIFFDAASIRSALSSKTIKSVRLYLSRRAGGTNSAQYINIYTHNYTTSVIGTGGTPTITLQKSNAGSYAVGDKKYISLPTSVATAIQNNSAQGIAIYASSGSPYCIFDGVNEGASVTPKLEITYEG